MQNHEKITLVISLAITAFSFKQFRDFQLTERVKMAEIEAAAAAQILVLHRSAAVIADRIRNGYYDNQTLDDILIDYKFEQISQHEK